MFAFLFFIIISRARRRKQSFRDDVFDSVAEMCIEQGRMMDRACLTLLLFWVGDEVVHHPTSIRRPIITQYIPVLPAGDFNQMGSPDALHILLARLAPWGPTTISALWNAFTWSDTRCWRVGAYPVYMRSSSSRSPFFFWSSSSSSSSYHKRNVHVHHRNRPTLMMMMIKYYSRKL